MHLEDYQTLEPMTIKQKLNPLGAHLLHEYYTASHRTDGKRKAPGRFYNINDPKDIPLIMSAESSNEIYGMIVVSGGRHRTPIIVKGNDIIVLESLGTSKSKVGINSVAQISIAISSIPGKDYHIYAPTGNRQIDSVSCGTDSFLAMKEGLKLGEKLFEDITSQQQKQIILSLNELINQKEKEDPFYAHGNISVNQFESLPSEIAKYSQSISTIKSLSREDKIIEVNSKKHPKKHETILEYANRHASTDVIQDKSKPTKDIEVILLGSKEVVKLKVTKEIVTNGAIDKRRKKHKDITHNMLKSSVHDIKVNTA